MAGYSGTPLVKKLGIRDNHVLYVSNPPESYFDLISPLPPGVKIVKSLSGKLPLIHIFAMSRAEFKKALQKSMSHLTQDGMIWVSWPKKAAKLPTDLNENVIRDFGLSIGLVDIKVCAVDDIWSGLKFVIPVKDRLK